jgi:hypothetical protein
VSPFRRLADRDDVPQGVQDAVRAGTVAACIGDNSRILEANDAYLELTGFAVAAARDDADGRRFVEALAAI